MAPDRFSTALPGRHTLEAGGSFPPRRGCYLPQSQPAGPKAPLKEKEAALARQLVVTVMPEYAQTEGVEAVVDRLIQAGVTGINTSPYVMAPADAATGGREPPADADAGKVRLLDRPLWGERAIFVRPAPSFAPDHALYRGLRYQPTEPDELTREEGPTVARFIEAAKARGLTMHLQVQAAIPPGYRVQFGGPVEDDMPRRPDGRTVEGRVDKNASLASPHILDYGAALLQDLAQAYPTVDGFRLDWPEYPPYAWGSFFFDFSDHARARAEAWGCDFEAMREAAAELERFLETKLAPSHLRADAYSLIRGLLARPALAAWLQFKSDLIQAMLDRYRAALPARFGLTVQTFPPPWTLLSGFDFARNGALSQGLGMKLYTMHWPMMLGFYAEALRRGNPGLDDVSLARSLVRLFDTGDAAETPARSLRYPEPDEAHPAGDAAQARKIGAAQAEAGANPVFPIVHAYGPVDDFRRRAEVAWAASPHGIWVNRYAYLADAKLEVLGRLPRG